MKQEATIRLIAIVSTSMLFYMLLTNTAFAQTEQSFGQTYVALALAVISLITNAFNAYLAQKAKTVGLNPNSTDEKIIRFITDISARFKNSEEKNAQLIDFLYNNAVPDKAKAIVEGSLPLIKIRAVTEDVAKADQKVQEGATLIDEITSAVRKTQ